MADGVAEALRPAAQIISRRTDIHRDALADLLEGTPVEVIAERLNVKKNSVYHLCARFDRATGKLHPWPWRRRKHPGRKPAAVAA